MGIICNKCRVTASSKCPNCRTVFLDNGADAVLSHVLKFTITNHKVSFTMMRYDDQDKKSIDAKEPLRDTVKRLVKTLTGLLDPTTDPWLKGLTFEQYICDHDWAWMPGSSSSIDCGCQLSPYQEDTKNAETKDEAVG